jgi:hypothetical protein
MNPTVPDAVERSGIDPAAPGDGTVPCSKSTRRTIASGHRLKDSATLGFREQAGEG